MLILVKATKIYHLKTTNQTLKITSETIYYLLDIIQF